jgi:polygalacturonase
MNTVMLGMMRFLQPFLFYLCIVISINEATGSISECGILNVKDYGAKGDGKTLDTIPITAAFQDAKKKGPGCTILFPKGFTFLSGPINITSYTTIHISENTTLRFPSDRALHPLIEDSRFGDLRYQPLIFCEYNCPNVTVEGKGTIDGDGEGWWPPVPSGMGPSKKKVPPFTFECTLCDNLTISQVTVQQCPFTCIHAHNSTNVIMSEITSTNPIDSPNTACVYLDSLTNARVTRSKFSCGDDHITVLASTRESINVLVDESTFYHGQGLTIGSQVYHGMTNVSYRNLVVIGALTGVRLKAQRKRGGNIVNLLYENIQFRSVGIMISVEMDYKHDDVVSTNPPTFNGVKLRNISGWGDLASIIQCIPESPCKDWELEDIFTDGSSEVVLPYYCENFQGTCKNCGSWPKKCKGLLEG